MPISYVTSQHNELFWEGSHCLKSLMICDSWFESQIPIAIKPLDLEHLVLRFSWCFRIGLYIFGGNLVLQTCCPNNSGCNNLACFRACTRLLTVAVTQLQQEVIAYATSRACVVFWRRWLSCTALLCCHTWLRFQFLITRTAKEQGNVIRNLPLGGAQLVPGKRTLSSQPSQR